MPPPIVTGFSCVGREMGYYADIGTNCRAYHTCDDHGNHFMHYCPEDTAFRQDAMICDHAYLVDCQANVDSVNQRTNIGHDDNHDAAPLSFVEPRGEGTHVTGFTRSFRINPDSKSSSSTKHPTFVLNSSVFLKDRNAAKEKRPVLTDRARVSDKDHSMAKVISKDYSHNPFLASYTHKTASEESISTVPIILSQELQPPKESSTTFKASNEFENEQFSFLIPPPIRDDNFHFSNNSMAMSKIDRLRSSNSRSSIMSTEPFSNDHSNYFEKDSMETVTFAPRTKIILEMMKARSLSSEPDFTFSKPSKFLLPPIFKSDFSGFSRSNFHFRTDDYPYVETLRSIQNNKFTTSTTPSSLRIHVTEASIFAIPTKPLIPAKELEKDPYYPNMPTTTESYYTSRLLSNKPGKPQFTTTRRPFTSSAKFEIPAVLPDLNSLEDLLDRRKFFFIPQLKS